MGVSGCAEDAAEVAVVEDELELEFEEDDDEEECDRDLGAGVSAGTTTDVERVAAIVDAGGAVEDAEVFR